MTVLALSPWSWLILIWLVFVFAGAVVLGAWYWLETRLESRQPVVIEAIAERENR